MPIQLYEDDGGKFLVIHATGKLVEADYKTFVPAFDKLAPHDRKLRLLFDMTGLHGWDAGAAWEDLKFDLNHFSSIERIAMIGEKPWQHGLATLFAPFTRATTRYFDRTHAADARYWLNE